jgi:hypothetical protein
MAPKEQIPTEKVGEAYGKCTGLQKQFVQLFSNIS